jgi:acetyl-CoA/propionyl-CoA carboxylase biotin carboxyl carrier protein
MSVAILGTPSSAEFRLEGGEAQPASLLSAHDRTLVTLAGRTHRVGAVADGATYWIFVDGDAWALSEEVIGRTSGVGGGLSDGDVRSPMPGAIIHFNAAHGEQVRTGQALLVVEALKMEHVLNAPRDGVVDFRVTIGDQVVVNQVIAHVRSLEASESEEPSGASKPVLSDQSAPQSPGTIRQTAQEKGI